MESIHFVAKGAKITTESGYKNKTDNALKCLFMPAVISIKISHYFSF